MPISSRLSRKWQSILNEVRTIAVAGREVARLQGTRRSKQKLGAGRRHEKRVFGPPAHKTDVAECLLPVLMCPVAENKIKIRSGHLFHGERQQCSGMLREAEGVNERPGAEVAESQ